MIFRMYHTFITSNTQINTEQILAKINQSICFGMKNIDFYIAMVKIYLMNEQCSNS